jgi:hypothetical protein
MTRAIETLADRLLALFVPKVEAAAACTPATYNVCSPVNYVDCKFCGSWGCTFYARYLECRRSASCQEICQVVGCRC